MSLADDLAARIARDGPLRLDAWMAACNDHYYATRDPFGAAGDFVTAPEISQMFGELIGGWIGDLWLRAGGPAARLVELGPGRGTLMQDARRVLARVPGFADAVPLHLVETSPVLRAAQAARLAGLGTPAPPPAPPPDPPHPLMPSEVEAPRGEGPCRDVARHEPEGTAHATPGPHWHDRLTDIPDDRPLIVIANEFFDALPIRQIRAGRELHIGPGFTPVWQPASGPDREWSPEGEALAAELGGRLRGQGGAALVIDYGHAGEAPADTLQALRHAAPASPFAAPGEADLTAHVDFAALARAAGVTAHGPLPQGVFLSRLGIEARAEQLRRGRPPAEAARIAAALVRLTAPRQMGTLFKAMALTAGDWPVPGGFQ